MQPAHEQQPAFSVWCYQTGAFREVTQKDLLGHWSLLFFYPADFTFVCPTELKELAEMYPAFQKEGCEIYSVSEDTHFVHKAWADVSATIRAIPYPMLADPAGVLARQYGVLDEAAGQAYRGAFLLNPESKVVLYEINDMRNVPGSPTSHRRVGLPGLFWKVRPKKEATPSV